MEGFHMSTTKELKNTTQNSNNSITKHSPDCDVNGNIRPPLLKVTLKRNGRPVRYSKRYIAFDSYYHILPRRERLTISYKPTTIQYHIDKYQKYETELINDMTKRDLLRKVLAYARKNHSFFRLNDDSRAFHLDTIYGNATLIPYLMTLTAPDIFLSANLIDGQSAAENKDLYKKACINALRIRESIKIDALIKSIEPHVMNLICKGKFKYSWDSGFLAKKIMNAKEKIEKETNAENRNKKIERELKQAENDFLQSHIKDTLADPDYNTNVEKLTKLAVIYRPNMFCYAAHYYKMHQTGYLNGFSESINMQSLMDSQIFYAGDRLPSSVECATDAYEMFAEDFINANLPPFSRGLSFHHLNAHTHSFDIHNMLSYPSFTPYMIDGIFTTNTLYKIISENCENLYSMYDGRKDEQEDLKEDLLNSLNDEEEQKQSSYDNPTFYEKNRHKYNLELTAINNSPDYILGNIEKWDLELINFIINKTAQTFSRQYNIHSCDGIIALTNNLDIELQEPQYNFITSFDIPKSFAQYPKREITKKSKEVIDYIYPLFDFEQES